MAQKKTLKACMSFAAAAVLVAVVGHKSNEPEYGVDGYPIDNTPAVSHNNPIRSLFSHASDSKGALSVIMQRNANLTPEDAEIEALVSDDLMDRVAMSESSRQADATNPESTATGKFQFIESTFLEQLYKHGKALGYGHLSRHIDHYEIGKGSSLRHNYTVRDPAMRARVLAARNDEVLSEELAKAYMKDNLRKLNDILPDRKTPMNEALAYMTHHFGLNGTVEIVEALEENPSTSFPAVAGSETCESNEAICFKRNGRARTVAEVHQLLEQRLTGPA